MNARDDDRGLVRDAARSLAPDYYVAALLAPGDQRDDLITLAAFFGETGRIAQTVSDDLLAEIRLQWWRDSLAAEAATSGHPVADSMRDLLARRAVDAAAVAGMLDARSEELGRLRFGDEADFDSYADAVDGAMLRLSAGIRGIDVSTFDEADFSSAGRALARVRVALALPFFAAHARLPVWPGALGADVDAGVADDGGQILHVLIDGARKARSDAIVRSRGKRGRYIDALLPVALLEPYLRALEAKEHDPLRDVAQIAPLTRISRLTWAHWRGRLSG